MPEESAPQPQLRTVESWLKQFKPTVRRAALHRAQTMLPSSRYAELYNIIGLHIEDITQELLTKALLDESLGDRMWSKAFVATCARNAMYDECRRLRRHVRLASQDHESGEEDDGTFLLAREGRVADSPEEVYLRRQPVRAFRRVVRAFNANMLPDLEWKAKSDKQVRRLLLSNRRRPILDALLARPQPVRALLGTRDDYAYAKAEAEQLARALGCPVRSVQSRRGEVLNLLREVMASELGLMRAALEGLANELGVIAATKRSGGAASN